MKIAIVGPSPIPFGIGGMEYLLLGLQTQINNLSEHTVELIKLPTKEDNFWSVINSYKQFYDLDLDHFDMVITTKYPAWMVQHKNQVCYMAHRLRGLYDTYHFMNLPDRPNRNNDIINEILDYIETKDASIDGLFRLLDNMHVNRSQIPEEHLAFPSPFAKEVITFLDNKALSQCTKFYAISETVKRRKEYFPTGADVEVVYPPSFLPYFKQGSSDYIFTISRLDNAKRIALMIEAMKYVKSDIKLKIAGTGPQQEELKQLAKDDNRIEFLGFVKDEDAIDYYANAKGVIYIPYEEDYGLVTIEAMMSYKPVITCYDSGGTTEFVEDGITGFISNSQPEAIARNIDKLNSLTEDEYKSMGIRCYQKVGGITWGNVVARITQANTSITPINRKVRQGNRKKITVTSTFPIYPPQGGGQARVYNLYKALAKDYDVEIVSFTNVDQPTFKGEIAEGVLETRIPKSIKHQEEESAIEMSIGIPITDIVMPLVSKYTPEYNKALMKSIRNSDLVVISHPYLIHEAREELKQVPFIYEAHNVEYLMKKELLSDIKGAEKLIKLVYEIEKECCENSKLIMACSEEDKKQLSKLYNVNEDKIIVVPNGVDTTQTKFTSLQQRLRNKARMGLKHQKIGMFMGSWHPPNLEACEHIFEIAKLCPDITFLLIGSQCLYFKDKAIPENVGLLGVVSEEVKNKVFEVVDFALNPMTSGSGTNLKMFDYMAAGIPIISTEFGTRGIVEKDSIFTCNINEMPITIDKIDTISNEQIDKQRRYIERVFDWQNITTKLSKEIKQKIFK